LGQIETKGKDEAGGAEENSGPGEAMAEGFGGGDVGIGFGELIQGNDAKSDSRDFREPEDAEVDKTKDAEDEGDDGEGISLGDPLGVGLGFEVVLGSWTAEEGHGGMVRGEGRDENS
jgi:hypothetical protein